jgi:hypothetical protein
MSSLDQLEALGTRCAANLIAAAARRAVERLAVEAEFEFRRGQKIEEGVRAVTARRTAISIARLTTVIRIVLT